MFCEPLCGPANEGCVSFFFAGNLGDPSKIKRPNVKAVVRWATGKGLTNRPPKVSLVTQNAKCRGSMGLGTGDCYAGVLKIATLLRNNSSQYVVYRFAVGDTVI